MADCKILETRCGAIHFDRTRIMGVVNVTPDSFYDGGELPTVDEAVARAMEMAEAGADIIDIGGESTRPGSPRVSLDEELARVVPVVEEVARRTDLPVSVDTYKAEVARRALDVGAALVNDVTALRGDADMVKVVAAAGAPVVLMHALWPPESMQEKPEYFDVVEDVLAFLEGRASLAMGFGVSRDRIIVDPGIGFGKTLEHNLELLRNIPALLGSGYTVLVGPTNKSFIGRLTGRPVTERQWGTAGAVAVCAASGAHLVRVHDAANMKDVTRVVDAIVWQV